MKYEFRRELMSDSYDQRTRVYFDPDAPKLDAATVSLLAVEMTVYPPPGEVWSFERLKAECLRTAAMLRNPSYGLAPPAPYPRDLLPYVEIVLTDRERICSRGRLLVAAGCIGHAGEDDHTYAQHTARNSERAEERVAALGEAVDLLAFLERKKKRATT